MHPMLNTAVKAARRAASIVTRASNNLDVIKVERKQQNDFVSEVDRAAEQAIIETILEAYPTHSILAEESGSKGDSEFQWIIDPLDGTTNFLHGFPQYAISIALRHNGQITQGVIYDPVANDLFTATRGVGAFLNDRRIRVSKRLYLQDALIGTGFPYREFQHLDTYMAMLKERRANDLRLRQTTSGIHRDRIFFTQGGDTNREIRNVGSQGQRRTAALALKTAQFSYMRQKLGATPVLLIDDILNELDLSRRASFIDFLGGGDVGQVFFTTTDLVGMQDFLRQMEKSAVVQNIEL